MKLLVTKDINILKEFMKEFQRMSYAPYHMVRNYFGIPKTILLNQGKSDVVPFENKEVGRDYKIESKNPALDLYYLEGMKLFNQGEFAKNKLDKNNDLGVYL